MKNPEEILGLVANENLGKPTDEIIVIAMKEYAKQWIEESVFWAAKQSEYGLSITEILPLLEKRIDAQ